MSEDTIIVHVDDTELDMAIAKAQQLTAIGAGITGTTDISKGTTKLYNEWNAFLRLQEQAQSNIPDFLRAFGQTDLPSINREARLIINQIPGLNRATDAYFRLKRVQRSVGIAVEDQTSLGSALLHPQMLLTLVATAILLLGAINTYYKGLKIEKRNYERLIRSYKDLTHAEFQEILKQEKNTRRRFPG